LIWNRHEGRMENLRNPSRCHQRTQVALGAETPQRLSVTKLMSLRYKLMNRRYH
jgi:hypothetical protein